ncbi:hypothetical protein BC940DRAFT_48149 [Gongronella butleri]|nr:hypothetical protein BC940DRAFT_48149 [Gongronella butleri]
MNTLSIKNICLLIILFINGLHCEKLCFSRDGNSNDWCYTTDRQSPRISRCYNFPPEWNDKFKYVNTNGAHIAGYVYPDANCGGDYNAKSCWNGNDRFQPIVALGDINKYGWSSFKTMDGCITP